MSAIVTTPPIILDAAHPASDDNGGSHFYGPFIVGTSLYAVDMGDELAHHVNVYKSVDNGQTWTNKDTANRPSTSQSIDASLNGTLFTIVYTSSSVGDPLKIITFDTATDTFGAPSVDGPLTNGNARIAQFASGDFCVLYGGFTLGIQAVVIFSAGAWGTPVQIPNAKNSIAAILIGANNIAQLFYFDIQAPGLNVFLRTFTNAGVLGAEQNVFSSAVLNPTPQAGIPIGRSVIWNGNFVVPYYGGVAGNQAGVWIGTPYTAPVWAFTLVNPVVPVEGNPPDPASDFSAFALIDNSNNLTLFWITTSDITQTLQVPPYLNQVQYAINAGTGFGAVQVFYDEPVNPPPGLIDGPFVDVVTLSATSANGRYAVLAPFCGCPTALCLGVGFLAGAGGIMKRCLL
jgi:hypothetical protein